MVNLSLSEKKRICHRLGDPAMDAMRFSMLAVSLVLLSGQVAPPLCVKIPLPAKNCTSDGFCESQIKIGNTAFVDGQGQTATQLSSFALDIIQFQAPDGPLVTNWIVYFNQYNHIEHDFSPAMRAAGEHFVGDGRVLQSEHRAKVCN
jgi:hypothetical protein